jgi:hypothetical protein
MKETELHTFKSAWQGKPPEEVIEGILSLSMETNRIPDKYDYEFDEIGKLIDSVTGKRIEDVVLRGSAPYDKEYEGLLFIQDWGRQTESGHIVWISPTYDGIYPLAKTIVSEIVSDGDKKKLLNRAFMLNLDPQGCIELGNEFSIYSTVQPGFIDTETLRGQPIPLDLLGGDEWQLIVEHTLKDSAAWELVRTGQDVAIKETNRPAAEALYRRMFFETDYSQRTFEEKQEILSIFGKQGYSCPPAMQQGAFNTLLKYSGVENSFPCPKCEKPIPSGKGITKCPHCGITKEEVGSNCD